MSNIYGDETVRGIVVGDKVGSFSGELNDGWVDFFSCVIDVASVQDEESGNVILDGGISASKSCKIPLRFECCIHDHNVVRSDADLMYRHIQRDIFGTKEAAFNQPKPLNLTLHPSEAG